MAHSRHSATLRQAGFGLAEIMIGLAIGLITMLIIVQVITTFDAQKRVTSGNADAQTNGSVALYTIQRQAQLGGFGLPVFSFRNQPLNCDPGPLFDDDENGATAEVNMSLSPVSIVDGGAGASDRIIVRSGATPMGGIPISIVNVLGNDVSVTNNFGCQVGDVALVSNGSNCVMKRVSAMSATTQITLESATGVAVGASLGCMRGWGETEFRVNNNDLAENGDAVVAGIVSIQAQYGISDLPNDSQVTAWVNASGPTWANPGVVNRNRIKAVRIAVVARNGQLVNENVTSACSSLTAAAPTGLCAWEGSADNPAPAIDLSGDPNWQRYRYRVFETIVPLRNMIWAKDTL